MSKHNYTKLNKQLLEKGLTLKIKTTGNSMWPFLRDGFTVEIKQYRQYNIGDIIIFDQSHQQILHRIIKKNGSKIMVKGDNNHFIDQCTDTSSILGKAISYNNGKRTVSLNRKIESMKSFYISKFSFLITYINYVPFKIWFKLKSLNQ